MLDYGCGDGLRGYKLFQKFKAVQLVQADVSDEMLKKASRIAASTKIINLQKEDISKCKNKFDLCVCLWNVLGHIPSTEERISSLKKIKQEMKEDGVLIIDVNNRHYKGYGKLSSYWKIIIDTIKPNYKRGDIDFEWNINGNVYPAKGHLFTIHEVKFLMKETGYSIEKVLYVNYQTGEVSPRKRNGQIFVIAKNN